MAEGQAWFGEMMLDLEACMVGRILAIQTESLRFESNTYAKDRTSIKTNWSFGDKMVLDAVIINRAVSKEGEI